ncbi:16S rRNA (guanine(966)-N(2))-methyltransferase RsmD [Hippea maritima]|uniref:Methyltransferase n=1 Tax=Hippea maritima (strain ATCC 700847 / DSM 10411 / MH2) TaxID=760142 RepID=F2LW59_HIPMA|nr:16S rRNA (guanine(966)-N(2))-methyltransferase RsmD [Hippea maritima]AEA33993.1 methyltransferase [Hippea maritima DSM 10411]
MRIIAGKLKYKRLYFKKNQNLRPTRNIVKKSFFDTMRGLIEGCVFLDLFAGSGSVGMEALSRGAKRVVFVDSSNDSVSLIRKNTNNFDNVDVIKSDAEKFLDNPLVRSAGVVYVDPPYAFDVEVFLEKLFKVVNRNAIVCVEHDKKRHLRGDFGLFKCFKSKNFGKNTLDYFGVVDE